MAKRKRSRIRRSGKVRKSYRLSEDKIAAAQAILGTPTATATIEEALDMIVFRRELIDGVRAARGIRIEPLFEPQ